MSDAEDWIDLTPLPSCKLRAHSRTCGPIPGDMTVGSAARMDRVIKCEGSWRNLRETRNGTAATREPGGHAEVMEQGLGEDPRQAKCAPLVRRHTRDSE